MLRTMYKPLCLNPRLLYNKSVTTDILNGCQLFIDGNLVHCSISTNFNIFLNRAKSFTDEQLSNSYILFPNGYKKPFFIFAPCRHCVLCQRSRRNDLILCSILEGQNSEIPPYFFTLTYSNKYLPTNPYTGSHPLQYSDIQKFFKRFRRNCQKLGFTDEFKYLVSGEYGKKSRPHYHIILYHNPFHATELDPVSHSLFREVVFNSWSKCEPQAFDFGQCHGGAFSYSVKYVLKSPHMPQGVYVKPFVHHSNNFGKSFIKTIQNFYHENPSSNSVSFMSVQDGRYIDSFLTSSLSRAVYPSLSASVPARARALWTEVCKVARQCIELDPRDYDLIIETLDNYRPFKDALSLNIICPKFSISKYCSTFIYLFKPRLWSALTELLDDLLDFQCQTINPDYAAVYMRHLMSMIDISRNPSAFDEFKLKDKASLAFYREKL